MYKEVAFDPSCMGSLEYYGLVRQHFGYDHGRYISADVKVWAKEAMQYVKQSALQPVKQKSIKNYLNKLVTSKRHDEFHLADDRIGVAEDLWVNWRNTQVGIRPFSFSVSESKEKDCISVDDINDGVDVWVTSRTISVERNANDIVDALLSLIEISNTITIIDQYFRLTKNSTLAELMSRCSDLGIENITVVTSMETPSATQIYNREYKKINSSGMRFSWLKAPDKFFHDRYFITNVGAIRSGQGFMPDVKKGTHADMANLNIIGSGEVDRTLADLDSLRESGQLSEVLKV